MDRLGSLPQNLSDNLCENCGHGLKYTDDKGARKWCKRCINVFHRKAAIMINPSVAEKGISRLVEVLYTAAQAEDLEEELWATLLNLTPGRDVFMFGGVGTGKTYAMAALLRHYIYEGFNCERINFDDFCVQVRSTMSPASPLTEWDLIAPLKEVDKLFIDDLGLRSKQETDFAYVTLYSILNKRQECLLPTFICSNKSIARLGEQFDARIASRLSTAEIIEIKGKDRRCND